MDPGERTTSNGSPVTNINVPQGGEVTATFTNKFTASPKIVTTASPASIPLGTTPPTISDSAVVSGAYNATGSLAFVLDLGSTQVYSTSDPLTGTGNGTYGTSTHCRPRAP